MLTIETVAELTIVAAVLTAFGPVLAAVLTLIAAEVLAIVAPPFQVTGRRGAGVVAAPFQTVLATFLAAFALLRSDGTVGARFAAFLATLLTAFTLLRCRSGALGPALLTSLATWFTLFGRDDRAVGPAIFATLLSTFALFGCGRGSVGPAFLALLGRQGGRFAFTPGLASRLTLFLLPLALFDARALLVLRQDRDRLGE